MVMLIDFKAILVVKGYKKKPDIDYFEVFTPVAKLDTIDMIIALKAQKKVDNSPNGCEVNFS